MVNKCAAPYWNSDILPHYQSGGYSGVDKEGNLCKGTVVLMVVWLKQSTPFIVQAIPQPSQARRHIQRTVAGHEN